MKSRYLRGAILEELRQSVPNNLERYRYGSFEYLSTDFLHWFEGAFDFDESQLSSLQLPDSSGQHDEENCACCYRALSGLSPYEARDERFWVYITHTVLLDHTRERWPIPEERNRLSRTYVRTFLRGIRGRLSAIMPRRGSGGWLVFAKEFPGFPLRSALRYSSIGLTSEPISLNGLRLH